MLGVFVRSTWFCSVSLEIGLLPMYLLIHLGAERTGPI